MLDIRFLRENPEVVKENIKKKFQDAKLPLVDEVIELDAKRRETQQEADALRADRNKRMMDEDGEKKLYVGDTIVLHIQLYDEAEVTEYLYDLVGREHEMKISELQTQVQH